MIHLQGQGLDSKGYSRACKAITCDEGSVPVDLVGLPECSSIQALTETAFIQVPPYTPLLDF